MLSKFYEKLHAISQRVGFSKTRGLGFHLLTSRHMTPRAVSVHSRYATSPECRHYAYFGAGLLWEMKRDPAKRSSIGSTHVLQPICQYER